MKRTISFFLVIMLMCTVLPIMSVSAATVLNPLGITEIEARFSDDSWDESAQSPGVPVEGGNYSFNLGDTATFIVTASEKGEYILDFVTGYPGSQAYTFKVYVNGENVVNAEVKNSGSDWFDYKQCESTSKIMLEKGTNEVKIENASGGIYFRKIIFEPAEIPAPSKTTGPYKEMFLPTIIEAEDFDRGADGAKSLDGVNSGKKYRKDDKIDIFDNGIGGYYISLAKGEWAKYTFMVEHEGAYTLNIAPNASGKADIYIDGCKIPLKAVTSANNSNLETRVGAVYLPEGEHSIKIEATSDAFMYDWVRFYQGGEDVKMLSDLMIEKEDPKEDKKEEAEEIHPIYKELYVAENGSDDGDGSKGAPFATIKRAQEEVKTLTDSMTGDIIVYIGEGSYYLAETLEFGVADSGKNGFDVIYRGENKDNPPILHGGTPVTGWQEYENGIYKAPVEADEVRNFYVDGQPMTRARSKYNYQVKDNWVSEDKMSSGFILDGANFPEFSKPHELETVWVLTWFAHRLLVEDIERKDDEVIVKMQGPKYSLAMGTDAIEVGNGKACFFENAMELLDEPGEFYYNKEEKMLYFYPYKEHNLETAEIYVPTTEFLLNVEGNSKDERVENITFDNIDYRYGAWNETSKVGFKGSQATHLVDAKDGRKINYAMPGQITVNRAENVNFTNSRFSCMTANAILMEDAVSNSKISGSAFWNIGGTAVVVDTFNHDPHFQDDDSLIPYMEQCENITVENNLFRRIALEYYGCTSIHAYYPKNIMIYHNDIADTPYTGFSVGWGWGHEELTDWNFDIAYNKVIGVNNFLSDGANLYTLGETTGSNISYNYFAKNTDFRGGIYNDSGSANINIFKNVFSDVGSWWFQGTYYTENIKAFDNFSERLYIRDMPDTTNTHTNELLENGHVLVPDGNWPAEAQQIIDNSGLEDEYKYLFDIVTFPEWFANPASNFPDPDFNTSRLTWTQAEDYVLGGEGVGYHKITPVYGTASRPREGVDLYKDFTSTAMTSVVATNFNTEWWAFHVDVPEDGEYAIDIRAGQQGWGSCADIYVDGELAAEAVKLKDDTSYWKQNITRVATVDLEKGGHMIKVVVNGGSFFFDAVGVTPSHISEIAEPGTTDEGVIVSQEEFTKKKIDSKKVTEISFADTENHWAKKAVSILANGGIINGVGDNMFAPDAKLTKEQATLLTLRALKVIYNDKTENDWINLALENGIIKNADNLKEEISREEFAEILTGAIVYKTGQCVVDITKSEFKDNDAISPDYKTSVIAASGAGLMQGDENGMFNPKKTLTRAEAATTIERLIYS